MRSILGNIELLEGFFRIRYRIQIETEHPVDLIVWYLVRGLRVISHIL
ncbi:hypothetical protein FOQG_17048 [Fusarium oxysporum f. sp. raphani 54005]|uniref:Uncharacterized protein n=4 Tax=Fusarium oxysporum TaxID=5507 RepID=X0B821_FUSOX|nr:hypothetical protein FOVG_15370 [Fusarium oxysporum f. sp. pisi HDV247]EXK78270.1 hypothetical protein FOQG_17048 [Fusarium oxysporum f. sp. raphani 54005]EXL80341.1 hypothetical protein FOPG_05981 [Fusarium oxysporum f. sp. conglutinans race 2 54008]EXM17741.1 hypothetical protein FOTG_14116 [Fusarium oxysporum f. sp. vasinfectum 25433]